MIASLSGVDPAYTCGNTNEARSKLQEATFGWNEVSAAISEREAREPKLLLNSLDSKLGSGAPAAEVNSSIYIALGELSEEIAGKARRQLTIRARAIASAGIIASFSWRSSTTKCEVTQNYGRRRAFVERRWRAASPGTPGQEISDAASSGR